MFKSQQFQSYLDGQHMHPNFFSIFPFNFHSKYYQIAKIVKTYADIPFAEKELSAEIAGLDLIHVRDEKFTTLSAADSHHREVLQQLTANCSCKS